MLFNSIMIENIYKNVLYEFDKGGHELNSDRTFCTKATNEAGYGKYRMQACVCSKTILISFQILQHEIRPFPGIYNLLSLYDGINLRELNRKYPAVFIYKICMIV